MSFLFFTLESVPPLEAGRHAVKAADPAVQATSRELENLWGAIRGIERTCGSDSFSLGFCLGVQLTPEGLRPVYPKIIDSIAAFSAPPCPPR